MKGLLIVLLSVAVSTFVYAEGSREGTSEQKVSDTTSSVTDRELEMALQDVTDDFEGTRQIAIDAYIPNRKQMAAAARYAEQGNTELASAMIQTLRMRPSGLESSIKFIRYQAKGETIYVIRCYVSNPAVPFDMTRLKALIDGSLREYDVSKGEEFKGSGDKGPVFNAAYYAKATLADFTQIGASSETKFKLYSADGESLIVELDKADLHYIRYFLDYLSRNEPNKSLKPTP
jgi:hypothetical protein